MSFRPAARPADAQRPAPAATLRAGRSRVRRPSQALAAGLGLALTAAAGLVPLTGTAQAAPARPAAVRLPAATSCPASGVHGPDVSSYQHPAGAVINWNAVKASGASMTFLNVREPADEFASDIQGAYAAGMLVGIYYYAYPTASNAVQEADDFAAKYGTATAQTLPPTLDIETTGGLAPSALVPWVGQFLSEVQHRTGRLPMIYAGPNFWANAMGGTHLYSQYSLWEAAYNCGNAPGPMGGWGPNWTFWQYTDDRSIPGIGGGTVDDSRFNGTAAQLAAFAASNRSQAPNTVLPVDPQDAAWVLKVVQDAAHVTPSTAGIAATVTNLQAGVQTRETYAHTIVDSPTGYNDLLNQDFEAVLHRSMSTASKYYWNALRKQGMTDQQVRAGLATSAEFVATAGATASPTTNAAWLTQLYLRLLNRPGTQAGIEGWLQQLAAGRSRTSVATAFLRTPEGEAAQVYAAYQRVLHRQADAGGSAQYVGQMTRGTTFDDVEAELYGSSEYYAAAIASLVPPTTNPTATATPTTG